MAILEKLDELGSVIQAHDEELTFAVAEAAQIRQTLEMSRAGVAQAEGALAEAKAALHAATDRERSLEFDEQAADRKIESAARTIAVRIIDDPNIGDLSTTLLALTYLDRELTRQRDPAGYKAAAERGRVAVSGIIERMQPGEPFLVFPRGNHSIVADVATEHSLVVESPIALGDRKAYVSISEGSFDLVLSDATSARLANEGLVKIEAIEEKFILFSGRAGSGLSDLETAASNDDWLVIGREAIVAKLAGLDPVKRFIALTALKATMVEVPVEVDSEIKKDVEQSLVTVIAFMASGAAQETTTRTVTRQSTWAGSRHRSHITSDTALTALTKSIDIRSIKNIAETIGLSRDELRAKVEELLNTRLKKEDVSLDQVGKDVQSLGNLDRILDTIF